MEDSNIGRIRTMVSAKQVSKNSAQEGEEGSLQVVKAHINLERNTEGHHTDLYDITKKDRSKYNAPKLVIRRGQLFFITVCFGRSFDRDTDDIHLHFETGSAPKESKNTLIILDSPGIEREKWGFYIDRAKKNSIVLGIQTSSRAIVGKWNFTIYTCKKSQIAGKEGCKYVHNSPIYLLFNPWCKEDTVYMANDVMLDECILNDSGHIFKGCYDQIGASPWFFGQFEEMVLDCSMFLLDKCVNYQSRSDPVSVTRHICSVVSSDNKESVLQGNWSGSYVPETAPPVWVSSVPILKLYYETKTQVKYGQCWVYSALCTTICRALGIPCRSVTNFASAHDCDRNITIDKHWDMEGQPLKNLNEESIWNFHVWNEAWMARRDLIPGFDGWQAFDSTPRFTSNGVKCAGPCPVRAIKQGLLDTCYDTGLFFAETNADRNHWKLQPNGRFRLVKVEKKEVGKMIVTQMPSLVPDGSLSSDSIETYVRHARIWDITDNYKDESGTESRRAGVYRARTLCTKEGEIYLKELAEADVDFYVRQRDNILVGKHFNVVMTMQNLSRHKRSVSAKLWISPVYYTGVAFKGDKEIKEIKSQHFHVQLKPIGASEVVMRVTVDEYVHKILEQVAFEIYASATVSETYQQHFSIDVFRLRRPNIHVQAPKKVKVGENMKVNVAFVNPLPLPLSECSWRFEGSGLSKTVPHQDIHPNDKINASIDLALTKAGNRNIFVSFTSKQITDINGYCLVQMLDDSKETKKPSEDFICEKHLEKKESKQQADPELIDKEKADIDSNKNSSNKYVNKSVTTVRRKLA